MLKADGGALDDPPLAAASFCAMRRAALRLIRGVAEGGRVDGTSIVSDRLCPGTPSNVFLTTGWGSSSTGGASARGLVILDEVEAPAVDGLGPPVVEARGLTRDFGGDVSPWPVRKTDARVARGAIAGGAVEATAIVCLRL
jgi:hypothetical protein